MADIIGKVFEHYAELPNELKAKLPLKQIWVPVSPDSDG
jgi:restriction system protein